MKTIKRTLLALVVLLSANAFGQLQMESAKTYNEIYVYKFGGITTTTIIDTGSGVFL